MKVMTVFGTRPEAIKMAPLVKALDAESRLESVICVTGQHRSMLDQVMALFEITPHHDLSLMTGNQTLNGLASRVMAAMDQVLAEAKPDYVLVHGDTTTACMAAIAAFHRRIPVGHVEAGLRTGNLDQPWPEEMNRRVIDVVSHTMFAPTLTSKRNLERENLQGRIIVTGNTVIDALNLTVAKLDGNAALRAQLDAALPEIDDSLPLVLVTGHRRENFGQGFANICEALAELARTRYVRIVYPVHLNPNVQGPVQDALSGVDNVHLIEPQSYLPFVRLMQRASIILTDSGGVQEEAPALGKPVLVMRDVTERPEAVEAGTVRLVGTDRDSIVASVLQLLDQQANGAFAPAKINPYGDGCASARIVDALLGRPFDEFAGFDAQPGELIDA